MLFQKLVEQHRVDRIVANGGCLTIAVTRHEVRIYLFDVLSNEPKPAWTGTFNLRFVSETHRLEVVDDFAGLVHRFDLVLETLRGDLRPKFALSIHVDCLGAARLAPDVTDVATVADIVTGVIDTNHATRGGDVGAG